MFRGAESQMNPESDDRTKCNEGNKRHPDQPEATSWFGVMVWNSGIAFLQGFVFGAYPFELLTTPWLLDDWRSKPIHKY